jgi:hypothetical protein
MKTIPDLRSLGALLRQPQTRRWLGWGIIAGCLIGIVLVIPLGLLLYFRTPKPGPSPSAAQALKSTQISTPIPVSVPPQNLSPISLPSSTPACSHAALDVGDKHYEVKTVGRLADGSLAIPMGDPGQVYWVDGTDINYVIGLSPTEENLTWINSLKYGDIARLTLSNCNTITYYLSTPDEEPLDYLTLLDQSHSGITIFLQTSPSVGGVIVKGELSEEQLISASTPAPDTSEIQAEISLLGTSASSDGKTIQVDISILNYGSSPFTLSENNIAVVPENSPPLPLLRSDPKLPREIITGAEETFHFTFNYPSTRTAVIRIFDIEYDLEY